ncbi:hypothetical protein [Nguyenibacter sp. L1]|uniref:hypothetical protein n=1 Tax=Nguyenibacter sp. L1 TaxID=3049350 RepID=UPI002B487621|nr:hypothetical protein [Nguyenibacter sp. L1]WRH87144.1 hypothetical protein QN315_14295 [Nguyenibacter sp. L1]
MLREVPGNAAARSPASVIDLPLKADCAASIAFFVPVAPAQAMVPRPFNGRSPKNASAN